MLHPPELEHLHRPDPDARPTVELRNVTAGYNRSKVLQDVDLKIMPGDFVGLLGPSGSGKTTLLRVILGAVGVQQGEVRVNEKPIRRRNNRAGYVPQLETIDWNFPVTVEEAVLMGRTMSNSLFPWFRRQERELAYDMMQRLGIDNLAKRHIRQLSGGQQQRVFLARALVSNPELLLLDEPTSGVDLKTRDDVMHLLHDLNHEGVTIVITTHEINAVAVHLPRLAVLHSYNGAGRVLAEGTPYDVITSEILYQTYGAEMPVIHYEGMPIVAESPHRFGRSGGAEENHSASGHSHSHA
jgi:zinc/manganese transport system ATP-binding protein/zinc transport system ATP-binding protein